MVASALQNSQVNYHNNNTHHQCGVLPKVSVYPLPSNYVPVHCIEADERNKESIKDTVKDVGKEERSIRINVARSDSI
jgi:hypothetical protein